MKSNVKMRLSGNTSQMLKPLTQRSGSLNSSLNSRKTNIWGNQALRQSLKLTLNLKGWEVLLDSLKKRYLIWEGNSRKVLNNLPLQKWDHRGWVLGRAISEGQDLLLQCIQLVSRRLMMFKRGSFKSSNTLSKTQIFCRSLAPHTELSSSSSGKRRISYMKRTRSSRP